MFDHYVDVLLLVENMFGDFFHAYQRAVMMLQRVVILLKRLWKVVMMDQAHLCS